jgi:hypothetical protein
MLRRVALVRTDVSEELSASIIKVTKIGELGTLAVNSSRRTLRAPHGVTSQKMQFFNWKYKLIILVAVDQSV